MNQYQHFNKSFINGNWVEGKENKTSDMVNPYDNDVLATVSLASLEQVNEAFLSAKQAQKPGARMPNIARRS